jgi:hypothetical protein
MITQAQVQELFNYDPDTGVLTHKTSFSHRKIGRAVGSYTGNGYLQVNIKCKSHLVHRICFLHYHGQLPAMVDHIDTDKSNNRILNLRECTSQENSFNSKIRIDNTSGIKGVSWYKRIKSWQASIVISRKKIWLGNFKDIEDARKAVEAARVKYHKEFSNHG